MTPVWHKLHPSFTLNGVSHTLPSLVDTANDLLEQGQPFEKACGQFLKEWLNQESTVTVQTSGSTGTPKKIELKKEHMVNSANATGSFFGLLPGQRTLLCISCNYIAGKMMLVRAMVLGLQLEVVEPTGHPLENNGNFDFCAMVPLQVQNSIVHLNQIKKLIIGGAKVSTMLQKSLIQTSCEAYETYGMTETITHVAARPIDGKDHGFTVLPDIGITKDERDCLVINAPKIGVHHLKTNDLVALHNEKQFSLLGRYDNIINSGGIKLIPEQIEQKLSQLIDHRFFIAGIEDEKLGQKLVLVVEGNLDTESLLQKITASASLSKYERPKEILQVRHFIETDNHKVLRKETMAKVLK